MTIAAFLAVSALLVMGANSPGPAVLPVFSRSTAPDAPKTVLDRAFGGLLGLLGLKVALS